MDNNLPTPAEAALRKDLDIAHDALRRIGRVLDAIDGGADPLAVFHSIGTASGIASGALALSGGR